MFTTNKNRPRLLLKGVWKVSPTEGVDFDNDSFALFSSIGIKEFYLVVSKAEDWVELPANFNIGVVKFLSFLKNVALIHTIKQIIYSSKQNH